MIPEMATFRFFLGFWLIFLELLQIASRTAAKCFSLLLEMRFVGNILADTGF